MVTLNCFSMSRSPPIFTLLFFFLFQLFLSISQKKDRKGKEFSFLQSNPRPKSTTNTKCAAASAVEVFLVPNGQIGVVCVSPRRLGWSALVFGMCSRSWPSFCHVFMPWSSRSFGIRVSQSHIKVLIS